MVKCGGSYAASPRWKPAGRTPKGPKKGFVPLTVAMLESQGDSWVSEIHSANSHAQDRSVC